jgi:Flp pilus assembly protein TadB
VTAWALLAALGFVVMAGVGQPATARLRLAVGQTEQRESPGARRSRRLGRLAGAKGRRSAAIAAGLAVAIVVPSWWGLLGAGLTAGALDHWLGGLPDRASLAVVHESQRQLPLALELVAAALLAGAPQERAVVLAAQGVGDPLARPLLEVAASLRLGASADEAWRAARDDPVLQPVARLAIRSASSGAAMAEACRDLGVRLREARVADAEGAIKRAGVLAVLPLALCFLPAFVLVGVVPLVVGLLSALAL